MRLARTAMKAKSTALSIGFAAIAVAVAVLAASPAAAQTMEDKLREPLRATVVQLRQVQDDQAALQAQKTAAEQERDALKTQLAAAKEQLAHSSVRSSGPSPELEAELAKYKDAYTQAAGNAQQAQAAHDKAQADLAGSQNLLNACEAKNTKLLKVGNDILDAYQSFDFGDALGANEPFIGTARVDLENTAQDFGDRLYNGKFDPGAVKQPAPPSQAPKTNP